MPDWHGRENTQQREDWGRFDYCRRSTDPREHSGAGELTLGGGAGQGETTVGTKGPRDDPAVCAQLCGIHGDVLEGARELAGMSFEPAAMRGVPHES